MYIAYTVFKNNANLYYNFVLFLKIVLFITIYLILNKLIINFNNITLNKPFYKYIVLYIDLDP